jgi:phosphopantetheinyl transferase
MARMRHPEDDIRLTENPIHAWIIKESVLKCIGTGLRLGMNRISVQLRDKDRFSANWNGHSFHGILLSRHDIRLSIVHTTSPL